MRFQSPSYIRVHSLRLIHSALIRVKKTSLVQVPEIWNFAKRSLSLNPFRLSLDLIIRDFSARVSSFRQAADGLWRRKDSLANQTELESGMREFDEGKSFSIDQVENLHQALKTEGK